MMGLTKIQLSEEEPKLEIAEALAHHTAGRLDMAEAAYLDYLKKNPAQADILHFLGVLKLQSGDLMEALHWAQSAVNAAPTQPNLYNTLGLVYEKSGLKDAAIKTYHHALDLDPFFPEPLKNLARLEHDAPDVHYNLGLALHNQTKYKEAIKAYSHAIALKPDFPQAHNNIGLALYALGKFDAAMVVFQNLVASCAAYAPAYNNLGLVLRDMGRLQEAKNAFTAAIDIDPEFAEAYNNLGYVILLMKRPQEALAYFKKASELKPGYIKALWNSGISASAIKDYKQAQSMFQRLIELQPDHSGAYFQSGVAYYQSGDMQQAEERFKTAIALECDDASYHNNLGCVLMAQGKYSPAIKEINIALKLQPDYGEARNNLGLALQESGSIQEAIEQFKIALALDQDYVDAHYNMGRAYQAQKLFDKAETAYLKVIGLNPDYAKVYNNIGCIYADKNDVDTADNYFRKAILLDPDDAEAHFNLGLTLLLKGDFNHGWKEYEWRLKKKNWQAGNPQHVTARRWQGESFKGKQLLVYGEQGFGDTLQFIRYLPQVKALGGHVTMAVNQSLFGILSGIPGIDRLVALTPDGRPVKHTDYCVSLLSLPGIFRTTLKTIPAEMPYISASESCKENWKHRINGPEFKVGIVWAGNPANKDDVYRSCALADFSTLFNIPGIKWIGMQKGPAADQTSDITITRGFENMGDMLHDFTDTAGLIANLNLVIAVDTAVVHLAGAMGKPVWTLRPALPYWVWMLDREDTPWYPFMKIFRQQRLGDWKPVFQRVAEELIKITIQ